MSNFLNIKQLGKNGKGFPNKMAIFARAKGDVKVF